MARSRLAPSDLRKRTQPEGGIKQVHISQSVLPTAVMNPSTSSTFHAQAYNAARTTSSSRSDLHLLSQLGVDTPSQANSNRLILEERVRSELVALLDVAIASRPNQIETVTNQGRSYVADGPQYQPALNSQWRQPAFLKSQYLRSPLNSEHSIHTPSHHDVQVNPSIISLMSKGHDRNFPEPHTTTTLRQGIVQSTPAWWISSELVPVLIDHPTTTATNTNTTAEVLKKRKQNDDDHGLSSHDVPLLTHRRWM